MAQYAAVPLEGWGPHSQPRPTVIHWAGPQRPRDVETTEWLQAAPKPHTGWQGNVSSLLRAPLPPQLVLQTANILRAAEICTRGRDTASIRCFPPVEGGARLILAHYKRGEPGYNDALSGLGYLSGPLLVMLSTNPAAALCGEMDGYAWLRVLWEAIADGSLLALFNRSTADGCRWNALAPHLTGRQKYMTTTQGHFAHLSHLFPP